VYYRHMQIFQLQEILRIAESDATVKGPALASEEIGVFDLRVAQSRLPL
jgi:hypothetical protein